MSFARPDIAVRSRRYRDPPTACADRFLLFIVPRIARPWGLSVQGRAGGIFRHSGHFISIIPVPPRLSVDSRTALLNDGALPKAKGNVEVPTMAGGIVHRTATLSWRNLCWTDRRRRRKLRPVPLGNYTSQARYKDAVFGAVRQVQRGLSR